MNMNFYSFLIMIALALYLSINLHDYIIKNRRFTRLLATALSAICILIMLINYAKG